MERMKFIILKEDLDPDDKLSEKEWEEFVNESSDSIWECCVDSGEDLLDEWSILNLNKCIGEDIPVMEYEPLTQINNSITEKENE